VMPEQTDEVAAIAQWLSAEVSPDTHINIMGQYRPQYQVGESDRQGRSRYTDIARPPSAEEMQQAYEVARAAGLWRFDMRQSLQH